MACKVENGPEYTPSLQVEESKLCTGTEGDKVETAVYRPDLQGEESRLQAGMNSMQHAM